MTNLEYLIKTANSKHKGIFYFINRNKKLGIKAKPHSPTELRKIKKALKQAKRIAVSRGRG